MIKAPSQTYSDWLEKASLIQQVHFHDKEVKNLHVELSKFMAFSADFLSHKQLERFS